MKAVNISVLLGILLTLLLGLAACGGGDGDEFAPDEFDPREQGNGGDPDEPTIVGWQSGPFTVPGGFDDLRGVAASQNNVYVATATRVFSFDKAGNFLNFANAPATVKGIAVLPPWPEMDLPVDIDYVVANYPVILHDPVANYGYITVYPPDLDPGTTREDAFNPDVGKQGSLPNGQVIPPLTQDALVVVRVYDIAVDRFGSILVTVDLDNPITPPLDWPRALQILNVLNPLEPYRIEEGGVTELEDQQGNPITQGVPAFHVADGYAAGDGGDTIGPGGHAALGTIATDSMFPFNRPDTEYTLYVGRANFLRDFVGVAQVSLNLETLVPSYTVSSMIANNFGYLRVIGESTGSAPGSFNKNPPVNPDGGLEDPDLTNGGPSGMCTDMLTDNVFICDPGNRRVQVFQVDTGVFLEQIGNGTRGQAGSSFLAPSEVSLDYDGNIYICDVTDLRLLREGGDPDYKFGNIGGTVRRLDLPEIRLQGATIVLGNEFGAIDGRTSNINGDYVFTNLLVGEYYLTATKFNYDSDTTTASVLKDQTVRVDFNLNPRTQATTGSYTGNIINKDTNLPVEGVEIHIVGTSVTAMTDSLGTFTILNLAPGTYQVVFSRENYETLTKDVDINSGVTTSDPKIEMTRIPLV